MINYVRVKLYADCKLRRVSGTGTSPNLSAEYTEEGLHKPYFNTSSAWVFGGTLLYNSGSAKLSPRKGHEFDEIEIPADYNELNGITSPNRTPKFIGMEINLTSGVSFTIPGWIDSIEPVAVKGPSANCRIKWHVDYWLTEELYRNYADHFSSLTPRVPFTFGQGRIKRGPASLKRPNPSPPRRWVLTKAKRLTYQQWVIVSFTKTDNGQTSISYCNWEPGVNISRGGVTYKTPTWDDVYSGLIEEKLGLDPNSVIGAWIAPLGATTYSTGTLLTPHTVGSDTYTAIEYTSSTATNVATLDMGAEVSTSDTVKYVFSDTTGTDIFTAPWGMTFRYADFQIDVGSSGANLQVYLKDPGENPVLLGHAGEGRLFSFPLPNLPVTENAWASYNYSGERDYDIQVREIQRNQAGVNGVAGIGSSALGGALAGSIVPGVGTAVGAAAGLISGAISTTTNYITAGKFDKQAQQAVDKLTSNQTAGMIITARSRKGIEPLGKSGASAGWCVNIMEADGVSKAEIEAEQSELGYVTDTYAADCSTIISQGGGLRIEGLEVRGDVPRQGRDYISALFARGVHLDIIN